VAWVVSPSAEANKDDPKFADATWVWVEDNRNPGEKMLKMIPIPVEVYASKKEAAEAAANLGSNGGEATDPTYPGDHTGWKLSDWQKTKAEIVAEYKKLVASDVPDMVAKKKICDTYEIKTIMGDLDPEKVTLLLTEQVV
jgi:hypothetical protein